MSIRHYTTEELLALRSSPLVAKPDNLPSIEQWLDESANANQASDRNDQRQQVPKDGGNKRDRRLHSGNPTAPEASPMGAFSTGRPTLGTRNSTARGAAGDDISLGPPKTNFPSSRHTSRLADSAGDIPTTDDAENTRAKFFSDRQMINRRSGLQDKDGRDNRDSWTRAAEKRALGGGDDDAKMDKNDRYGRHDAADRNGFGDKGDTRWSNGRGEERRQNGDRPAGGGWREREQARRNNGDRHDEREPEWMDDPVVKKDQELNFAMPKSQEEFQKWKDSMKVQGDVGADKEKEVVEAPPPPPEPKQTIKLEGFEPGGFFAFNAPTSTSTPPAGAVPGKTPGKAKTSRFASMFKPPVEEQPPAPPSESHLQKAANGFAKTTAEDQEGFNNVLKMLNSGLKITPPSESPAPAASAPQSPPQPTRAGANGFGAKPKSRFFQSQPESAERLQSPHQGGVEVQHQDPAVRPPQETPEPSNMFNALREQQPRPSSGRVSELAMFDPPSRSAPSPDINIQNLLAQQRQRPQMHSHESQNLLNLLKKSDPTQQPSRPPSQQTGGGDQAQLQRWLDHQHHANSHGGGPPPMETFAPKPARLPQHPPGLFEEQLMRNFPSREDLSREQQMPPPGMPEPRRQQQQQQQRAPPGFYDEREILMQQQLLQQQQMRRNFGGGDGPQQMPPQPQVFRKPQPPPQHYQGGVGEYHITSPSLGGPPPGFPNIPPQQLQHGMPRHPPGFGGQPPQQHPTAHFPQQREQPPPGSMPPGFGPPAGAPPGFYGAGPPPPGFGGAGMRGGMDGMPPQVPPGMRGRPSGQFDGYGEARRG